MAPRPVWTPLLVKVMVNWPVFVLTEPDGNWGPGSWHQVGPLHGNVNRQKRRQTAARRGQSECELGRMTALSGTEFDHGDTCAAREVLVNPALNKPDGDAFLIHVRSPEGPTRRLARWKD